ncbi:BYPASS-related protein [Tanacetum coccineum]
MEDTINNDSFASNLQSLEELNPGSFLLPFTTNNYNSYAMANIDASNNVIPRSIYEYLKLANLGGDTMSVEMDDMTQQETLGTVKNVLVKIDKFEFPCDFVDTRNYDTIDPQIEIVGQTNPLLDKGGLTKRWHVCKPVQVFYDDKSGKDCGMWPTCDPDSSFCCGYKEVFGKCEQGMLRQWVCFHDHERRTVKGSCMEFAYFLQRPRQLQQCLTNAHIKPTIQRLSRLMNGTQGAILPVSNQNIPNNDPTSFSLEHLELGEKANISKPPKLRPFRPYPCDYSFDEWLKVKIGHTNIYDSDREIVFNEWILDNFDVEEEYAKEIRNPYSQRFEEYK